MFSMSYPALSLVCFLIDQLIKGAVRRYPYGEVFFRMPKLLDLVHFGNTGAAFSMFSGRTEIIVWISLLLLAVLAGYFMRSLSLNRSGKIALSLLIGGALGNMADRLIYREVTDYIRLSFIAFPVFNFADILITTSVFWLAYELLTGKLDRHSGE